MLEEKLRLLLEEKFLVDDLLKDCFVVDVVIGNNNKVEVFFDSDSGVTIEKCRIINRYLEGHIDENKWIEGIYSLEVSSPGISRPLTFVRQYQRNIGRTLEVTLTDGTTKKAKMILADDQKIILEESVKVKEGKKNVTQIITTEIPYETIKKAIVKVTF
ncbi:MAG: ribosome maturation factor [Saprospiraceae bacterium]|nr:ribosome maturation factor [Saprospiraceae bacterium]